MPKVKHAIIRWARDTSKLSIEDAAHKLNITDGKTASAAEKLVAFEDGKKAPSRSLLLRMSKVYHRPLLTFYLDKQPAMGDRGDDFRTLPDDYEERENAYVDVLVRDIKARQNTVRETLIDADEEIRLGFVGKHTVEHGAARIVQTIRQTLDIDLADYRAQSSNKEAFKFLRQRAEAAGVFVLLKGNLGSYHSSIGVSTFRGFVLADDVAPFIVINDGDAESAWSFTLVHEMSHLVLGQSGLSGGRAVIQIEKFCNDVASEFMLPKAEFDSFQLSSLNIDTLKTEISDYAFSKKLSSTHIAYRLYRRGDIEKLSWESLRKYFRKKWLKAREKYKKKISQTDGGPSYYVVHRHKLGALVGLVERLTYSGALTTTKAGMLLDMKPLKVHRLFQTGQPA